jgi:hypothetical protein
MHALTMADAQRKTKDEIIPDSLRPSRLCGKSVWLIVDY